MNQDIDNHLTHLTMDVYERFIENVLEMKDIYEYSNTRLFLPTYSSEWMEKILICFLTDTHEEGYIVKMLTMMDREIDIELDLLSGTIYEIESHIGIYVGMGNTLKNKRCPYFFIRGQRGLMSWSDGTYEDLKNRENRFPITLLQNVIPKKINIQFEQLKPKKEDILELMENLSDTKLTCTDGELDVNRYLLSKNSYYFMTYFSKYTKTTRPKIDFPKMFMQEYIRFLIINDINEEKIYSNIEEWIYFGSFIQDFEFVKCVYDKVCNKCDRQSRINLDNLIHQYITCTA